MSTRTYISGMISLMVNAVLFGSGAVVILAIPALREHVVWLLPAWIVFALVITPPIAWFMAPRLRLRYWRQKEGEGHVTTA